MADLTDFVAALRSHVLGGSVPALIGDRLTPIPVPEGQIRPRATYTINSTRPATTLAGDDDGLLQIEFQIDSWAGTFGEALQVAEAIRIRLQTASFRPIPEDAEGNGVHLYEDDTKLHRFHWRYVCQFPTI